VPWNRECLNGIKLNGMDVARAFNVIKENRPTESKCNQRAANGEFGAKKNNENRD